MSTKGKKNHWCTIRVTVRASSHMLYLLSVVESTEPKQVYSGKLGFVSERTIKDIIITATQRVHPPHLPSSPGPPLCTSNMAT
jgi:hypothetical protein